LICFTILKHCFILVWISGINKKELEIKKEMEKELEKGKEKEIEEIKKKKEIEMN